VGDLATLAPLAGGGGIFGVLVIVIVYQLSANRADRQQAQTAIADAEARADAAEAREKAVRELAAKREGEFQDRIDIEREARRRAEDGQAEVLRQLAELKAEVQQLKAKLATFTGGGV
jgi:flagellar biosynthesis/type III secretory pathway M-ring protein FliF/YscJ